MSSRVSARDDRRSSPGRSDSEARRCLPSRRLLVDGGANPAVIPGRATSGSSRPRRTTARRAGPIRRAAPAASAASRRCATVRPPHPRAARGCAPAGARDRPRQPAGSWPARTTIEPSATARDRLSTAADTGQTSRPAARRSAGRRSAARHPPRPRAIAAPGRRAATRLVRRVPMSSRRPTGAACASSRASMPRRLPAHPEHRPAVRGSRPASAAARRSRSLQLHTIAPEPARR